MEYTCDVVVVAAGPSGLAAAITAAENDCKVIVLEKNNALSTILLMLDLE